MTGPLDPEKVAAHIAERKAEIDAQAAVVEKLEQLVDDEQRQLTHMERQLAAFKDLVDERGLAGAP